MPIRRPDVEHPIEPGGRRVPGRALAFSLLALSIPVFAAAVRPEGFHEGGGLLHMLPALIPPFLLSYYKGWVGGSRALAAGMATLALVQVEIQLLGVTPPPTSITFGLLLALIGVSVGSGWISELLLREREAAERLALVDPLTRLPNRRHLEDALHRAWARAIRGAPMSVVLFDLDRFKAVNDRHGHATGDSVLRRFGDVLAERTRGMDISGRLGGEEFLTVLVDCDAEGARQFADDVRERVAAIEFRHGCVTVSAGVAMIDEGMSGPDILIAAADHALYRAKEEGRNRVVVAPRPGSGLDAPAATAAGAAPGRTTLDGTRVLVVDDDDRLRRALSTLLGRLGCVVSESGSGLDAIERLRDGPEVDLLVTDVIMPGMSGFALADVVSRFRPELPVLYISGYPQSDVYWGGTPGVVRAFLEKPVDVEKLEETLGRLLHAVDSSPPPPELDAGRDGPPVATTGTDVASMDPNGAGQGAPGEAPRLPDARILLVDDDVATLRTFTQLLERAGIGRIEATTSPVDALARIGHEDFDLLITDLHMPEMTGFELLERVGHGHIAGRFLPVLVLTGNQDPEARRRAFALGASDFLAKPFDATEARARVRNLLQLRSLFRDLATERDRLESMVLDRTAKLVDSQIEIAHRLATAAEYRDDMTGRHAARVGLLASHIADELGLPPRSVDLVRRAAPLHDVGKIGIPDDLLLRPGPLSEEELDTVREHTRIGAEILGRAECELLRTACDIALRHHERWDGTGYPDGLCGEAIPLAARITAVADTYDVITHRRPYKAPLSSDDARREIVRCSGTHFDPRVVEAFARVWEKAGIGGVHRLSDPVNPDTDTDPPPLTRRPGRPTPAEPHSTRIPCVAELPR